MSVEGTLRGTLALHSRHMILTTLLIGALLTGAVLTFMALGVASPVPWLFLAAIVIIVIRVQVREKARLVKWKDEYSVGIEQLDQDHRNLLNLINRFQTTVHYKTGEEFEQGALAELIDYTKTHFAREEDLLKQHDFPGYEAHRAQHREMIEKVDAIVADYKERGHKAFPELANYLTDWLLNHINGTDKEYSSYLNQRGVR